MTYELMVGLRYTRAKRRNRFISFISLISMAGIALGVMVLIVVLSVMNGFQTEVRTRILGVASHLQISGPNGTLQDWPSVAKHAAAHPRVVAAAPYVQAQGMRTSAAGLSWRVRKWHSRACRLESAGLAMANGPAPASALMRWWQAASSKPRS